MPDFAIVIPAYNEPATIRGLAERALRHGAPLIVVDDGSNDGTARALDGLAVRLLRHERNQGKDAALWHVAEAALALGAQRIVTLDGDGPPSLSADHDSRRAVSAASWRDPRARTEHAAPSARGERTSPVGVDAGQCVIHPRHALEGVARGQGGDAETSEDSQRQVASVEKGE